MYLSRNDKARVMHLYKLSPYLSAKSIAKNLNLKWKAVFEFLVTKGYSVELHLNRLYHKGEYDDCKATDKKAKAPKAEPKVVEAKTPAISLNLIDRNPSPETQEKKKQKMLYAQANKLLEEATRAGEEGRYDDYMRLRKEYEMAKRRAEAYKMRGNLNASDKVTYWAESHFSIIN